MADVHEPEVRSYNMSQIKSKDTKPEILVRKFLFSKGFRYRINYKKLPGTPDIVLPKLKTVIFIHGCFWHGHEGCRYFVIPKTRTKFWTEKISTNISRDKTAEEKLVADGWKILKIWECELKPKIQVDRLGSLLKTLKYIDKV
ncbi:MAG TPA: very short patch repair endonuclease [Cytophagales bacterium]|nr:very short patch repair endonuclease [Cytophagales bacterium]